ncbi:uncharacterized protein [Montipora capricornis]|uniref:uncharacterized protein n=1 Tax=Montipora capricornis TaxID=246305 RepID=UPI0035F115E8
MASGPVASASTKESTNYARLCRLLVDYGTQALRDTFDAIHPPATLHRILSAAYPTLQGLKKKKIINPTQWGMLYPATPSSVTSSSFDITLLMVLLRNICGLSPPASTGSWDTLPPSGDNSPEANIAKIKYYRNNVCGHASQASVDDATFNVLWQDISKALLALGSAANFATKISQLKTECMDPVVEEHYRELLKLWKDDDDSTKEMLEELKDSVEEVNKKVDLLMKKVLLNEMMTTQPRSELPEEVSNMHGRAAEVDIIFQAISDDSPFAGALVSGIPGIGKSTVAIRAGHQLKDKCQSIVKFCSLRDVHQLEMEGTCKMEGEWREILNVCDPGHQQANKNPRHVLLSWCRRLEGNIVLILDNAEDSMEDGTIESFSDMLRDLRMCSDSKIKFLITSRRSDKVLVSDLKLNYIKLNPLGGKESIEILKGGAKISSGNLCKVEAQLSKVAELCENIPLALQLAGPLLSSESEYDFEELIQALENNPTETLGHGLQQMMEIAFEKLDRPLKDALVCLSVFVRSFDKKAAVAMIGVNCAKYLMELTQRCLIQKQDHRYLIHLFIRSYARQMGKRDDFVHILFHGQQRFVEHFLSLLQPNSDKFWGKDTCKESFDLFNEERINLESTLEEIRGKKIRNCRELEFVVDNCQQLASYLEFCVPFQLYRGFLDGLLHFAIEQGKVTNQVEILLLLHHESREHGNTSEEFVCRAIKLHDEHPKLFKKASQVFYLSHYGRHISQDCGSREKAQPILKEAISIFEEEDLGSTFDKGRILVQLGHNEKFLERHDEARKYYEEALSFRQEHYGQHLWTAFAHKDLADSYLYQEKLEEAKHHYHKAISILKAIEVLDQKESIPLYKTFGICHQKSQNFDESRRMFEKGIEIADSTIEGNHKWKVEIKTYLALLLHERFPEEMAAAGKICEDVLKMGKDLEMKQWSKKYQLQKLYRKIQGAVDAKTRYTLLCCLLVRQGSRVLKDVFDRLIHAQDLCSALKHEPMHSKLQSLRKEGILNAVQWSQLYPVEPSSVSSTDFERDPSFLIVLLRTICNLSPPSSGWARPPRSSDTSCESDIVRLKYCVNAVAAHAKEASVSNAVFCKYKDQIQKTLVRLGGAEYEDAIHELEKYVGPSDEEHFKERLKQWKDDDDRIKDKLNEWECLRKTSGDAVVLNEMMTTQPRSELPEEVSNMHGRSAEVDIIFQAISDDSPFAGALVSGIPGIGKSTVAIRAGHQLKDKCQSIVKFCSLRDVRQLEMEGTCKMEGEWRELLNVCDPGHQQANKNPRHVLLSWCRRLEGNIVLILDNAEDSMEDGTIESFSDMLRDLRMCSDSKIKFLITSRRSDKVLVSDLKLKYIKLNPLGGKESIEVLKDGAKISSDNLPKVEAQLNKVAELCENIPLALQLAGPLLSSESEYDFEELIQALEKNPTETLGHGLQQMMEIAFEKLDRPLKDALVCLSVFVQSFDKKAAVAMIVDNCGNYLTKLKQRCLIQKQGHRYLIHLLIRDYARQVGKRDDFADILAYGQQRFVEHFLSLLKPNSDKFWGKDTCKESFDLFNEERINLESTLTEIWGKKIRNCRELEVVVDNCQQLASYLEFCVPCQLYCGFLDGLLHFAIEQGKVTNQVEILLLRHHESRKHGSTCEEFVCRAIKLHDEHPKLFKKASQVFYLSHYGRHISQDCGRRKAQPILKEAISIFEEEDLGSTFDKGRILVELGHGEKFSERHEEPRKYYEEALSFRQEHYGQHLWTAFAHKDLADFCLLQKKLEEAKHHYHKAISILKAVEVLDQKESIPVYENFGICHQKSQNFDESRRMFEKGIEIADSTIEGNHECKVEIKTRLALLLDEGFPLEIATAGKICEEVLKMGEDLEMQQWPKKKELQKLCREIQVVPSPP